jgi:hypothetical protein
MNEIAIFALCIFAVYAYLVVLNIRAFRKISKTEPDFYKHEANEMQAFLMRRLGIVNSSLVSLVAVGFCLAVLTVRAGPFESVSYFFGFLTATFGFNIIHDYFVIQSKPEEAKK